MRHNDDEGSWERKISIVSTILAVGMETSLVSA